MSKLMKMIFPENFPVIECGDLLLRKFEQNDLEDVFIGLSDPAVIKYYGVSYDSLEATREQMEWFAGLERQKTGIWWAICSANNKTFYGAVGINNLHIEHRKAEIGFWLLPDFWGGGIMFEAVTAMCGYALDFMGLHRIEAYVETENIKCKNLMNRLGFIMEGTMRECELKNGEFVSLDIYAKLSH